MTHLRHVLISTVCNNTQFDQKTKCFARYENVYINLEVTTHTVLSTLSILIIVCFKNLSDIS